VPIAAPTPNISTAEKIRRTKAADPSLTDEQLGGRFDVKPNRVREALKSKGIPAGGKRF
jgi:hypothetical protein